MVYAAAAASLAVLETAAHVDPAGLPLNKFLISIEVPDAVWARAEVLDMSKIGASWSAIPAGLVSVQAGSAWLRSMTSAILLVPSVIVPEESAALINPAHPDAKGITAREERKFVYDLLFRPKSP
jgi:RES domain-containing protein